LKLCSILLFVGIFIYQAWHVTRREELRRRQYFKELARYLEKALVDSANLAFKDAAAAQLDEANAGQSMRMCIGQMQGQLGHMKTSIDKEHSHADRCYSVWFGIE